MRLAELLFSWSQLQIAAVSLLVSVAIVLLSPRMRFFARRADDTKAVQAMHVRQTPRLGGVAIFAAFALTVLWAPLEVSDNYTKFFGATCLLFIVGLSEDLGFHVSPRNRLLAAIGASCIVIFLLGVWLPCIGIPGLDPWMSAWWIGPPLTLLLTAGIANGFNLIDGVNGLSGLTAIVALVALAGISEAGNYDVMVQLALMMAACILGFWVINFPMGFIVLGDAGANAATIHNPARCTAPKQQKPDQSCPINQLYRRSIPPKCIMRFEVTQIELAKWLLALSKPTSYV